MSPQVLLASTLAAVVILASSVQPGLASRVRQHLWPGRGSADDDAALACGFFNTSDPVNGGVAHQPCYGEDGSTAYCCLSGSSKCSCAAGFTSGYQCYNYESDSPLNAVTGEECGYFVPSESAEQAFIRRILPSANCTYTQCPADTRSPTFGTCTRLYQLSPGVSGVASYNSGVLLCYYLDAGGDLILCNYDTGNGRPLSNLRTDPCCPTASICN